MWTCEDICFIFLGSKRQNQRIVMVGEDLWDHQTQQLT